MGLKNGILGTVVLLWFAALLTSERPVPAHQSEPAARRTPYLYNGHQLDEPTYDLENQWLQRRKTAQEDQARAYKMFPHFRFTDKLPESGITFKHSIVDDASTAPLGQERMEISA
jgi:hypothetical protein